MADVMDDADGHTFAGEPSPVDVQRLLAVFHGARRLVVYTHDNPDPDAIASAWLLAHVAEHAGLRTRIVYGGRLGRAENRMMVRLLRIPLRHIESRIVRRLRSDRHALVDTQPGTGNNSYSAEHRCNIVIDHHPARRTTSADFVDIRPGEGCTATMLLGYFEACGLVLEPRLATAVAYAIVSETQDLKREATRADKEALHRVLLRARLTDLGRIRHPVRSRDYYVTLARALRRVTLARNVCVCHIGTVGTAEVVAEVADLLAAMERISWCLVTGWHEGTVAVSLRSAKVHARAERVMRALLGRSGQGGGHGMIAGGSHACPDPDQYPALAATLSRRFLERVAPGTPCRLHPLLPGLPETSPCEPVPDAGEDSLV
jgi:nanoRNase/pAp phosphatase (c-di-AMP/oligoRNAs hydrolase)